MILPWLVGQVLDFNGPQALMVWVFTSLMFNLVSFIAILRLRQTMPGVSTADVAVLHE
jgi:hypothetical protein